MYRYLRVANLVRRQASWLGRRYMSGASHAPPKATQSKSVLNSRFGAGLGFGLCAGFLYGIYDRHSQKKIGTESFPFLAEYVDLQPPTDIAPFPATITVNKVPFQALGTGVRTVTFLNFHVYAAGIYIAVDDLNLARKVLSTTKVESNDVQTWMDLLSDPVKGTNVIDTLLRANVRLAIRIIPTRTTGFGHLRDGFIKSIMKRPEAKAIQSPEFGEGMNELRRAFGRKKKLEKGEVITWARESDGGMTAWHGEGANSELLGSPADPDVSRLFFLQYLTGKSPSSPTLKEKTLTGLSALAVTAAA